MPSGSRASGAHFVSSPGVSQACTDSPPAYICGICLQSFHQWGAAGNTVTKKGKGSGEDPGTQTSTSTRSLPFSSPSRAFLVCCTGSQLLAAWEGLRCSRRPASPQGSVPCSSLVGMAREAQQRDREGFSPMCKSHPECGQGPHAATQLLPCCEDGSEGCGPGLPG